MTRLVRVLGLIGIMVLLAAIIAPATWATPRLEGDLLCPQARGDMTVIYFDLGDTACTGQVIGEGWSGTNEVLPGAAGYDNDVTVLEQRIGADNSLLLPVEANRSADMIWWVGHGVCEDSWQLYINGQPVAENSDEQAGMAITYHRSISAALVSSDTLLVTFRNTSTDVCGVAGVYGILLTQS